MPDPIQDAAEGIPVDTRETTDVMSFSPLSCAARALAGATSVEEVMWRATDGALTVTGAQGAFVERVIAGTKTVEVAAAAGERTPPLRTRVPYPGSLTEEMIEGGDPAALDEIGSVSEEDAPYLARSCEGCTVLAVPLLSEGELLGALILLRVRGEPAFSDDDHSHARILGDLAAVSLRRVLLLEEAERSRRAADEERETLFDPYWQATRTGHLGAGLGLSISRGIVEAHGGKIWAESEVGAGSAFRFTLPAAS